MDQPSVCQDALTPDRGFLTRVVYFKLGHDAITRHLTRDKHPMIFSDWS